jgi:hypothetical protein
MPSDAAHPSELFDIELASSTLGSGWTVGSGGNLVFEAGSCNVPSSPTFVPLPPAAKGSELHIAMAALLPFNVLEAQYFTVYAIGPRSRIELRIVDSIQPAAVVSVRIPYGNITAMGLNVQTLNCTTHVQPAHVTIYGAWLTGDQL